MPGGASGFAAPAAAEDGENPAFEPPFLEVQRQDFIYQIVWQETLISERLFARGES